MSEEEIPLDGEIRQLLEDVPEEILPEADDLLATFKARMWLAFHWWQGENRVCFSERRAEELAAEREDAFSRAREEARDKLRILVGRPVGDSPLG